MGVGNDDDDAGLDGWTLSLSITNVTNPDLDDDSRAVDWYDVSTFAALGLVVSAPGEMGGGNDSNEDDGVVSWKVCATVYGMYPSDTSNYTQVAQDDKGTCAGYLNATCVEALRSAAAESFAANRTCQYKTIPDVCLMGDMGTPGEPGWSAYENATIELTSRHYRESTPFFTYSASPSAKSDDDPEEEEEEEEEEGERFQSPAEVWEETAKMVYAVLFTWGYESEGGDGDNDSAGRGEPSTSLFAAGVAKPDDTPDEDENEDESAAAPRTARPLGPGMTALVLGATLAIGAAAVGV
ncbi:hypothetical protein MGN70_006322 [Eutypa lata]|nr:hypothetical protein MGN70_006322 [Eutypa lata]